MTPWAVALLMLAFLVTPLAVPLAVEAQQAGKMYRLGLLGTSPPSSPGAVNLFDALLQGLRELGYVEGQNLVIERRHNPEARAEGLLELATELVSLPRGRKTEDEDTSCEFG